MYELKGNENEDARKLIRSANDMANCLVHKRSSNYRDALICFEATRSIINFVSIVSGRLE